MQATKYITLYWQPEGMKPPSYNIDVKEYERENVNSVAEWLDAILSDSVYYWNVKMEHHGMFSMSHLMIKLPEHIQCMFLMRFGGTSCHCRR